MDAKSMSLPLRDGGGGDLDAHGSGDIAGAAGDADGDADGDGANKVSSMHASS